MNKVFLIGNLTRDPELTETNSGISVCKFSIAVNRNYTQDGERLTDFFTIVTWRGQAENCAKYLTKGRKISVVGTLQNRSYEDRDGNKRTVTEVQAQEIEFLTANAGSENAEEKGQGNTQPKHNERNKAELESIDDGDLPF